MPDARFPARLAATLLIAAAPFAFSGCERKLADPGASPPPPSKSVATIRPARDPLSFVVRGEYGLEGTISKDAPSDKKWKLRTTLQFPTGGFAIGTIRSIAALSAPEQIIVTIPVIPPGPNAMVTQEIATLSADADIPGSNEAQLSVIVETLEAR